MSRTKPTPPPATDAPSPAAPAAAVPTGDAAPATAATARADANRRRILDVAFTELTRDPDATMDQIARAAGVVRRTVYGHFPSREALVGAILDEAVAAVTAAHSAAYASAAEDPPRAVASAMLSIWHVTDRYRLLLSLAQRAVTMEGIRERLAPVHAAGTEMLQRALDSGRFVSPLPARALVYVLENTMFGLMEAVNEGVLEAEEGGRAAAVSFLCAAGMPPAEAAALVAEVDAARSA
ncbi:TetR/AcrR family transcriptional regulator [Streptomyces lasiicapitis]|uniref:TetR/AcrR family transcriptional regulator n=1 Tax=Streptomyces lasiicapitis TaxID=1923961 RepID=UPI0036572E4A